MSKGKKQTHKKKETAADPYFEKKSNYILKITGPILINSVIQNMKCG